MVVDVWGVAVGEMVDSDVSGVWCTVLRWSKSWMFITTGIRGGG